MSDEEFDSNSDPLRHRLHEIIFEADTLPGKIFDVVLLLSICLSVLVVLLDSVQNIGLRYGALLDILEWIFTFLFTVEYILRIYSVRRPLAYVFSFYGIVDLLAILPTYLAVVFSGAQFFLVVRILRLLRVFRIFKLTRYVSESRVLMIGIRRSLPKITVFLVTVLTTVVVMGSVMYLIEGEEAGFTSIPRGIYWSIVTLTTVGYGDIAPKTALGQTLSAILMILGYGIIAVPTGIVSVHLARAAQVVSTQACPVCSREGHDEDAKFCKYCGSAL